MPVLERALAGRSAGDPEGDVCGIDHCHFARAAVVRHRSAEPRAIIPVRDAGRTPDTYYLQFPQCLSSTRVTEGAPSIQS